LEVVVPDLSVAAGLLALAVDHVHALLALIQTVAIFVVEPLVADVVAGAIDAELTHWAEREALVVFKVEVLWAQLFTHAFLFHLLPVGALGEALSVLELLLVCALRFALVFLPNFLVRANALAHALSGHFLTLFADGHADVLNQLFAERTNRLTLHALSHFVNLALSQALALHHFIVAAALGYARLSSFVPLLVCTGASRHTLPQIKILFICAVALTFVANSFLAYRAFTSALAANFFKTSFAQITSLADRIPLSFARAVVLLAGVSLGVVLVACVALGETGLGEVVVLLSVLAFGLILAVVALASAGGSLLVECELVVALAAD